MAKIFYALSSLPRLKIIALLEDTDRPLHIKAVSKALKIDYATVYRHIRTLEAAGIVEIYDVGRSRVVEVKDPSAVKELISLVIKLQKKGDFSKVYK